MTTRYFSSLIEQSLSRSTEATLSIMGVTNRIFASISRNKWRPIAGKKDRFLPPPYLNRHLAGKSPTAQ